MKKHLYSLLGCAALLTVSAASGREALSQVFDNVRSTMADETPGHEGEYLRSGSVVDLQVKYDGVTDKVNLSFTSPRVAYWNISYDYLDENEFKTVDYIRIYRNEGIYYDENARELVHEMTDVPVGTDLEWTDETPLVHGKTYYYMVIPGIGENDGQTAGYNVEVGLKIDPATDYEVLPGERGAKEATVKFTAPTTANEGKVQVTTPIDSIEVIRKLDSWYSSEEVIYTFHDVQPGSKQSYTDSDTEGLEEGSRYSYRIVLYWDGSSTRHYNNVETVLMGQDKPAAPGNIVAVVQEDGSVKVTWEAPTSGADGGWFDPAGLTYKVERGVPAGYSYTYTTLAENLDVLEFVDENITEEGAYRYQVTSCLNGNESRSDVSNDIVAGPPAGMPFTESWPNQDAEHSTWEKTTDWTTSSGQTIYDSSWETICDVKPFDYDNGFMMMRAYSYNVDAGTVETLTSGRIAFADAVDPFLQFYFFDLDPEYYDNILKVYVAADGGEFQELTGLDCQSGPGLNEWIPFSASLISFAGAEYIQIRFEVTVGSKFAITAIDAVEVREKMPVDLVVKSVTMPAKFYPGAEMNINVTVENTGDDATEPFGAMVTVDGAELAFGECAGIEAHKTVTLKVPVTIVENTEAGVKTFAVEVEGAWEADMTNNSGSAEAEVVALPAVAKFAHETVEGGMHKLSWEAVEELPFTDGDTEVAEDFSSYDHGDTNTLGDWVVIDGDGAETYNIPGATNEYPGKNGPTGGMVLSPAQLGTPWDTPVAGGQCFIFIAAQGYANDWLISPELNGTAQTLTFKAMAPASWGAEAFSVMISTTDNNVDSFTELKYVKVSGSNGETWEEHSYELPAGTKYFAINYTSNYGDALCLTDFHFITGSGLTSPATEHLGYNVYCDGKLVNDEVITDTEFTLPANATDGLYTVKAVYNNAESAASEGQDIILGQTGIGSVDAAGALLKVEGTTLVISGTGAYTVVDLAGRTVAAGTGATRVAVAPGTYVVVVDGQTFKVAAK